MKLMLDLNKKVCNNGYIKMINAVRYKNSLLSPLRRLVRIQHTAPVLRRVVEHSSLPD